MVAAAAQAGSQHWHTRNAGRSAPGQLQNLWFVAWPGQAADPLGRSMAWAASSVSHQENEREMLCGRHVSVHDMHDVCVIDLSSLVSEHKLMAWNGIALVQVTCSTLHFVS